jgi:hypothetical protein
VVLEQPVPLFLLSLLGVGQTLEVITMLNANRMVAVAMPGVILLVWIAWRSKAIPLAAWCLTGALMMEQAAATQVHRYVMVKLPSGIANFQTKDAEEVSWLVDHTQPGDSFFEVMNTRFYAPLELKNPSPVDVLGTTDRVLPVWVDEAVEGLEKSRTRYILCGAGADIGAVGGEHPPSDHMDPLRRYMREHYARAIVFGNGEEVWKRNDSTDGLRE